VTRDAHPDRHHALADFVPEARDHLDAMSRCLLALEQGRATEDTVPSLFRAVHTLKGAAYVVGQTAVGDLAYGVEGVLAARHDRGSLAPAAIGAIHAAVQAVRRLLGLADDSVDAGVPERYADTLARLRAVAPSTAPLVAAADALAGSPGGLAVPSSPPAPPRAPAAAASDVSASPSRGSTAGIALDRLVNLAGELVVARRGLEGRLHELARLDEVLSQSGARMARAVGELEDLRRPRAGAETASGSIGHTPASGDPLAEGDPDLHTAVSRTDFFSELDRERFDHVDVIGRSLAEITADLTAVRSQVTGLAKHLSEDTARVQRLTAHLRGEIARARLVPVSVALLVRVGSETLAIPVNAVSRVVVLPLDHVERVGHGERVWVDERPLDLLRMDQLFGLTRSEPGERLWVVALRTAGRAVALAVDEILGKEEILVKSVGEFLQSGGPFGGATISDDERIILLLDPARLLEMAEPLFGSMAAPRGVPPSSPADRPEPPAIRRILLIDDSISVRKFVGQILERAGFDVVTAGDGVEGLRALEETRVHLVITDLEMPRLNGFELIQQLRRRADTRELPIVALTTRTGATHLSLARWLGATAYVAKPVDEPAFVRLIDALAVAPSHSAPPSEASESNSKGEIEP